MIDDAKDFVSLRVKPAAKARVEDEQDYIRRSTGTRPTQTEVVHRALDALARERSGQTKEPFPEEHMRWHQMLETVLSDPDESHGIEKNLQWAVDSIASKNKARSARRKVG